MKLNNTTLYIALFQILATFSQYTFSQNKSTSPVVETYQSAFATRSGIALGGIGTGSLEIRKDGIFHNWSIFNNYPHGAGSIFSLPILPNKKIDNNYLFFIIRYEVEGEAPKLKLLQIPNNLNEGAMESISYYYPWMSSIEKIEYSGRFPFANLKFTDSEMPLEILLECVSPFIPHDIKNSSLPGTYFNFKVKSKTNKKVKVMLLGTLRNLVGYDKTNREFTSSITKNDEYTFFTHSIKSQDTLDSSYGEMGLGVIGGNEISYYLGWEHKHPYYEKLLVNDRFENIDDTKNRNIADSTGRKFGRLGMFDNDQRCFSSIATSYDLEAYQTFDQTFFMNWHFPNNYGAIQENNPATSPSKPWQNNYGTNLKLTKNIGHFYQNSFQDLNEITNYFVSNHKTLDSKTRVFTNNMYQSDIDQYVLDQVNSHLNTFITSTTLSKSGTFLIREGITSSQQWGPTATIDVGLYGSQMLIALFPELQKSMMKAHKKLQSSKGEINHGLALDPDYNQNGTWGVHDRLDLVPNYIQMVLRDYFWTNDKAYLENMWPSIKLGINYILNHRDEDNDMMPNMNGIMCSYDNFPMYGLASYIQSQWVITLKMAAEAANDMNDKKLHVKYNSLAEKGIELMESKLWNGSYYSLYNDYLGTNGKDDGCLTDQLIGQWISHTTGFGHLFKKDRIHSAINKVLDMSFKDKQFLRNCSWPEYPDLFPIQDSDLWVDQANTPWTGVELAFASFLIYEGMTKEGEEIIKAVDNRHRKNGLYWNHQEFGGHYYRPMSSWSIINAYLGLSIKKDAYHFNPKIKKEAFSLFFSGPNGTAQYIQNKNKIQIKALTGSHTFKSITLKLNHNIKLDRVLINNKEIQSIKFNQNGTKIEFKTSISLKENESLFILYHDN